MALKIYRLTHNKLQRFFLKNVELNKIKEGFLENDICHQILNVLRMRAGEQVILLDNTGFEYLCELYIDGKKVRYKVLERNENLSEASVNVALCQALLKSQERFEWSAQKATELGVSAVVPLITERCQVGELRKKDRVEKIMKEASEQCERGRVPELKKEIKFEDLLNQLGDEANATHLFFYEGLRNISMGLPKLAGNINVIIGPEGGFSADEVSEIEYFCSKNKNAHMLSLGKRILRSETASIVALAHILTKF